MPTAYTEILFRKQVSFKDFVMRCAREFGALVTMREEPLDTPIPEKFEPSNYYLIQRKKAEKRLAEIQKWDKEQAEEETKRAYQKKLGKWQKDRDKDSRIRRRIEKMLTQVQKWEPPLDYEGLKQFMINQLEETIEFDFSDVPKPKKFSGTEYQQQQIAKLKQDIQFYSEEYKKEVERTKVRNKWVRGLRKSLK